jgi:hypothetical protein
MVEEESGRVSIQVLACLPQEGRLASSLVEDQRSMELRVVVMVTSKPGTPLLLFLWWAQHSLYKLNGGVEVTAAAATLGRG